MNLLSFARINYDCTIFWRIQWIFYEYTVFIANLIRIIRVFRDITSYSLWNYNFLREFTLNSLSILRIHYLWRDFTINSFGVSRIHYESTINFTNMICVLYTHEYIKNALSSTLSHYHFASLLWIHYFSREFIINSVSVPRIHYLSRQFTVNSLSIPQIHYEFTVFFGNSLWTDYPFREFTICFANIIWIYYLFADLLWIHSLFHEFSMNSLSISRIN